MFIKLPTIFYITRKEKQNMYDITGRQASGECTDSAAVSWTPVRTRGTRKVVNIVREFETPLNKIQRLGGTRARPLSSRQFPKKVRNNFVRHVSGDLSYFFILLCYSANCNSNFRACPATRYTDKKIRLNQLNTG